VGNHRAANPYLLHRESRSFPIQPGDRVIHWDPAWLAWQCDTRVAVTPIERSDAMLVGLIIWLIVGAIAGWLAGQIVKGYGFGLVWNIVIGILGGLFAGWLLPMIGIFNIGGVIGAIVYSVIGAVILLLIVGLVKKQTT
jgi:uncharacterized membrane protein YeaQ/YmgE (transglycosylase-associated protein family)